MMISKLETYCKDAISNQHFDHMSIGVIDFNKSSFETFLVSPFANLKKEEVFFDLASVTKPLTLACSLLVSPELDSRELDLLVNHRAGLPAWGLLSKDNWRETVSSYSVVESPTLYSDFSALRAMVEIEKKKNNLYDICSKAWGDNVYSWLDLPVNAYCPPTGFRNNQIIKNEVHDPNAYVIKEKVSHAGLFATIEGLCESLIVINKKYDLIDKFVENFSASTNRFKMGFDTVTNSTTLAGKGCSEKTFGHLGFTGTSFWIDPEKKCAQVILSNGTKNYWYDKSGLNEMRRSIGEVVWSSFS